MAEQIDDTPADDTTEPESEVEALVLDMAVPAEIEISAGDISVTVKAAGDLSDVVAAARLLFQEAHPHRRPVNPIGFGSATTDTERDPDRAGYRGPLEDLCEEGDEDGKTRRTRKQRIRRMERNLRNLTTLRATA